MGLKMKITVTEINGKGIRISLNQDSKEVGRAFLYILNNDLHQEPFGFMEDVFVNEEFRKQGNSKILINKVIEESKKQGCYKLIFTSRHGREELHSYYESFGFKNHGKEFRMNL